MQAQSQAPLSFGGAAPDKARMGLVLVHGRGGSARDILGLGEALGLPDVACVAPEAPGHSWWPTSFLAPLTIAIATDLTGTQSAGLIPLIALFLFGLALLSFVHPDPEESSP